MSETEFVLIAAAIVIGVTYARLLEAAYHVVLSGRAREWWIPLAWLLNRFLAALLVFWAFRRGVLRGESFDFLRFLYAFVPAVFLYVEATALTTRTPSLVEDWHVQFRKARKPFFVAATIAALINGAATTYFDLGTPLVAFLVSAALFSIGLLTRDPKVHGPLVIAQSLLLVGAILGPLVRL